MRKILLLIHRWCGLTLALFLILAGLTGSIIAFEHELDRWLNPELLRVVPTEQRQTVTALVKTVERAYPTAIVTYFELPSADDEAAVAYVSPRDGEDAATLAVDQVFVDPFRATILGARDRMAFRWDRRHLITCLYTLHYSLHLGQWGMWVLGGLAIVWFGDSFVALALAWPTRGWGGLRTALSIKIGAGVFRTIFDLHRAAGLWFWGVLTMLAFTAIAMNLHTEVFAPAVNAISPLTPWAGENRPPRDNSPTPLTFNLDVAIQRAHEHLTHRESNVIPGAVWIDQASSLYHIAFHTASDLTTEHPGTWVTLDASNGDLVLIRPAGGFTIGDTIDDWQFPLHSGKILGLGGRIMIAIAGLITAMLSITGIWMWWHKRSLRRDKQLRAIR